MTVHRLFIALRPPPAIRRACLAAMADGPVGWAWQDDDQLHVTLRYIGEVDRPIAEDIAIALGSIHAPPVALQLDGVGLFDHGPRSALFARVAPREPLNALHDKIDRMLVRCGLEPERRTFFPHITVARKRRTAHDPTGWLAVHAGLASAMDSVSHVTLFESRLGRHGATYEPIARYPLDLPGGTPI